MIGAEAAPLHGRQWWLRVAVYLALYVLGAAFSTVFIDHPDEVTLIWPPAGVAYALLLYHGLRWWPTILVGQILAHLLVAPIPPAFWPFSLASNVLGALAAVALLRRIAPPDLVRLRVRSGFLLLCGGVAAAAVCSLIGVAGLIYADMVPGAEWPMAAARWALGDLFGIVAVGPVMLMTMRVLDLGRLSEASLSYAGWRERALWVLGALLSVVLSILGSEVSPTYALGMSFLPLALLLWSALRFEPVITAAGTLLLALTAVALIGLSIGGFQAPRSLLETFVLLTFLSLLAIVPQVVATATYQTRAAALDSTQRARRDRLTGLPNRLGFEEQLNRAMARESGVVGYLDLDGFKVLNDSFGHVAGDDALRQMASLIRSVLPPQVQVARIGGDEFGLYWPAGDIDSAERDAQRLRRAIAEFRYAQMERVLALTASIGLAHGGARQGAFGAVFAEADSACFAAKELGGNRVQRLSMENPIAFERGQAMRWAARLQEALEHDRFELYGQAIVPLSDPEGIGHVEILLRLHGSIDEGLLLPSRFMPAAERFQLASRIDRYVVDRALRWLEHEAPAELRDTRLAINLSGLSIADDDFVAFVRERLQQTTVPAHQLSFELTETGAVRDLDHARHFIADLKALGVGFALDDFGSGFCSFGYLKRLDVDHFKIDGSFIRELTRSELSEAIVRSIVEIARVLGRKTTAEWVEDSATIARLRELGVDYGQGHACHRPQPLREITREVLQPVRLGDRG